MKTLINISWRNIWRNPKRSLVMIIAITLGLWAGLSVSSLSFGMLEQRFHSSIEQHISHIQIHHPDFLKDNNVRHGIKDWQELFSMLSQDEQVETFAGRTIVNGMLASANLTRGVNIMGVDPAQEAATTGLHKNIYEGEYFPEKGNNQILIGKRLADKTKLRVGSRLVLTFQNAESELISATFRVAGIFRTANSLYDERNVYLTSNELNTYTGEGTIINEIAILAKDQEKVNEIAQRYQDDYPEMSIRTWAEISPELSYMQEMAGSMLMMILGIILFALAFGLVNTMLMSVFERIHELGMLMAIGMNKKKIFSMIMLETAFLTFVGALAGMLAGYVTIRITNRTGIDLALVGGEVMNDLGFPSMVYPYLESSFFITLTGMVVITAAITSVFPSIKALRLNPAEAVRKE